MAREQRKLAAILAADVVGYSRLMGRNENGTLAVLVAFRHGRVNPAIRILNRRAANLRSSRQRLANQPPSVISQASVAPAVDHQPPLLNSML